MGQRHNKQRQRVKQMLAVPPKWEHRCPGCGSTISTTQAQVQLMIGKRNPKTTCVALPCLLCKSKGEPRVLFFGLDGFRGGWQQQGWSLSDVLDKPKGDSNEQRE